MSRPPESVVVIARHHCLTGGAMLLFVVLAYSFTRRSPAFELSDRGYAITLGIAVLYLGTGTLVWIGAPLGRYLSYACSFIYLARPQLGLRVWRLMGTPDFKAHFARPKPPFG